MAAAADVAPAGSAPATAATAGGAAAQPSPLAGGAALFAVQLDASYDDWTASMLAGVRAAAGADACVRVWSADMPDEQLADVDALFCWAPPPGLLLRLLPRLRLVASLGAGVDHVAAQHAAVARHGVALVRCVDPLAAQRLAQYVLWAVLHVSRRMDDCGAAQRRAVWDSSLRGADAGDTRVGVMGLGAMGAAAAEALARNGFVVSGWSRSGGAGRDSPLGVARERLFAGDDALAPFLAQLDVLVCVLPLTDATRGALGAAQLRALPRGAALINVGRAECVVQDDLLAALDDGHLSRAVLDVAPQEPLPGASCRRPLLSMPFAAYAPALCVASHSSGRCTPSLTRCPVLHAHARS
jgi:glyoxylate/hydroxypyruvate reductase A